MRRTVALAGVLAARGRAAVASAAPCAAVTAHPIRDARHSRFAVSILRGGSLRDMSSMPRASAHDFKLPLVGASPPPAAVLRMPFSEMGLLTGGCIGVQAAARKVSVTTRARSFSSRTWRLSEAPRPVTSLVRCSGRHALHSSHSTYRTLSSRAPRRGVLTLSLCPVSPPLQP